MKLERHEAHLVGAWTKTPDGVKADDVAQRIKVLVESHLVEIAVDASGWDTLFMDPDDGRFWELTYPESYEHGGGPPHLAVMDRSAAELKYGRSIRKASE
jgi:hypothetical protein